MPGKRRDHYKFGYDSRAADIRARANADPATRCGRCGRTLAEHPPTKTGKPPTWDAGHVRDGDPTSGLRAEVAGCNRSAGAIAGNRRRIGLVPDRDW